MKKIVHYNDALFNNIVRGDVAFVYPIDHPDSSRVTNTKMAKTSLVLEHDLKTGIFETRNTIYKPVRYAFAGI